MPAASPIMLSFSSGELSRLFDGRVDLEEYASGCRKIENFIPLIQGPAVRRGGTVFTRELKDSGDKCGSLRFEFSTQQSYFFEVGDLYIRFYTDHGIVMNGTNPLELATPWVAGDLFDTGGFFTLREVQTGDVQYITQTGGTYPPQKLTRSGALSWSIVDFPNDGGPFKDIDPDATITAYPSGVSGGVTLTASSAIFLAGYVGSLFLIEMKNDDDTKVWEAGKAVTAADVRRVDDRYYEAGNSATTGGIVPTHTRGSVYDGNAGVQWEFLHPGYGWARITAVGSSGTTATATVLSRFPASGSGSASTRWAFGAWSDLDGWPTHVAMFRERLVFARANTREFWMSEAGDFERFRNRDDGGEIAADSAIRGTVQSDHSNPIQWMAPADRLVIGTAGEEFLVGEITTSEPFGPGNVKASPQTAYGSKPVRPVLVGDSILYVQGSGRKLRDLRFSIERGEAGGLVSTNLSVLAPHLFTKGLAITGLAYQQEPYSVIWVLRSDGLLLATTINANQKRFGWHRHPVGGNGIVEAIEVISNPDGDADELWMIVRRTIDGTTRRYVEYMVPDLDDGEDVYEAFYVDSGLTYDGAVNAALTPGSGATEADSDVTFTAGSSVFLSGDVGRQIHYRYYGDEEEEWKTARAEITARTSGTVVQASIIAAWPDLAAHAAGEWRMTVMTISALDHLEGETVKVLADGASHPDKTVSSGSITLDRASTYVHVGLACPCVIQTMRPESGSATGTAQGKTKRIHNAGIRLTNTVGGSAGPNEDELDEILFREPSMAMDEPVPPFSGDKDIAWPDGYTQDAWMTYVNTDPLPATVVAFLPRLVTNDR